MANSCACMLLLLGLAWFCNVSAESCNTLLMAGSTHQTNKQGLFHLQPSLYNNRPVYKHQCADLYIYYVQDVMNFWIVGPKLGQKAGFSMTRDQSDDPAAVTSTWRSWKVDEETWVDDSGVTFTCLEPCSRVVVSGRFDGIYYPEVNKLGDRAVYFSNTTQQYLFYTAGDFTCPRWVFSESTNDTVITSVSAFLFSSAVTVTQTSHRWNIQKPRSHTAVIGIKCSDILDQQCGDRVIEDLVGPLLLYGDNAYHGKWPFSAALLNKDSVHKCGATLISEQHLLIAAHCVDDWTEDNLETIWIGVTDQDKPENSAKEYNIESVYLHPNYSWTQQPFEISNDIAVLKLASPVELSDYVRPACLPTRSSDPLLDPSSILSQGTSSSSDYEECHVIGWGRTSLVGNVGGNLQDVRVRTFYNMAVCGASYYPAFSSWIEGFHGLCVQPEGFGKMCEGDSGSPMMCRRKGSDSWHVMGVASWALITCLETNTPSVYALVDQYTDWIYGVIFC